ncbi:MAG: hypothetical protein U0M42_07570 [Acutalibacteraceae bacterium]|nr:hypothetical protein [Acutalibacteraceae bacterium]
MKEIEGFEKSLGEIKKALLESDREKLRKMMQISTVRRKRFDKRG